MSVASASRNSKALMEGQGVSIDMTASASGRSEGDQLLLRHHDSAPAAAAQQGSAQARRARHGTAKLQHGRSLSSPNLLSLVPEGANDAAAKPSVSGAAHDKSALPGDASDRAGRALQTTARLLRQSLAGASPASAIAHRTSRTAAIDDGTARNHGSLPLMERRALFGRTSAGSRGSSPPPDYNRLATNGHASTSAAEQAHGRQVSFTGSEASLCSSSAFERWARADLLELAGQMSGEVTVKDRFYHMKRYKNCFVGEQAVDWMLRTGVAGTADEAVAVGNAMLRLGLLHHVKYEHAFENKYLFYRFHGLEEAEPLAELPAHHRGSVRGALRPADAGNKWSLAEEVTRLQRTQCDMAEEMALQQTVACALHECTVEVRQQLVGAIAALEARLAQVAAANRHVKWQLLALLLPHTLLLAGVALVGTGFGATLLALAAAATVALAVLLLQQLLPSGQAAAGPPADLPDAATAALDTVQHSFHSRSAWQSGVSHSEDDGFDSDVSESTHSPAMADVALQYEGIISDPTTSDPAPPPRSAFEGWPDRPALLRLKPLPYQRLLSGGDPNRLPMNTTQRIEFETDLFKGCAVMFVAGLPTTPEDVFAGKQRKTRLTVQGRFKRELGFDEVVTGQVFGRPAKNLPAKWLVEQVLMKMARAISPSVSIGPLDKPFVLVPVVAMAQGIVVSQPGEEPDLLDADTEDMSLFHDVLLGKDGTPMTGRQRMKHFWSAANRQPHRFDTEHVWTFHMFQHQVDCATYELDLMARFDLSRHLDGQPLQFMALHRESGSYLFSFEIWHEKLLAAAYAHAKQDAAAADSPVQDALPASNI